MGWCTRTRDEAVGECDYCSNYSPSSASRAVQKSYNWHKHKTAISHLIIRSIFVQTRRSTSWIWITVAAATVGSLHHRLTLHPNMRDRVRLLQMTLHWHMTGERHFKFLTGRDISPDTHSRQTAQSRARWSAASHSEPRYS